VSDDSDEIGPMKALLGRLFYEAKQQRSGQESPDQAPVIECFVMLVSGGSSGVQGDLSTTPEGALRMLSHSNDERGRPILIEHFFPYSSIVSVSIRREVTPVPRIHSA